MTAIYVDPVFRQEVLLHLFRNFGRTASRYPLLLAVTGPTGEGKTFQTDEVLRQLGVPAFRIESGELESELAGQPAERIRLSYLRAGSGEGEFAALVINDLDTALGDWGSQVQYTVNRQAVFGQLMALCDAPTRINNQECARVPVIVTGNDFTRLYAPLTRAGRMRTFSWTPGSEQRIPIIATIFPWLDLPAVRRLASTQPDEPVAFWVAVAGALDDDVTIEAIGRLGEDEALRMAKKGKLPPVDYAAIGVQEISRVATRVAKSSAHKNFLKRGD